MDFIEFRNFALECCDRKNIFNVLAADLRGKLVSILSEGSFFTAEGEKLLFDSWESAPDPLFTGKLENLFWLYRFTFKDAGNRKKSMTAECVIYDSHVKISVKKGSCKLRGFLQQGRAKSGDLLAMKSDSQGTALLGAAGPAVPLDADLLYNRQSDCAVQVRGKCELSFDWKKRKYRLEGELSPKSPLEIRFEKNYAQKKFQLKHWKSISYRHGFSTPPVGWMTWYAVRFAANEKIVLENAAAMKEHFGKYCGDMVIWVDWEWCHKTMRYHSEKGVDAFHPRQEAYPHGMKYVADGIRKMGLIPAVWTGATCEGNMNEYFQKHPDYCLADVLNWPGRYWADLSHEGVQREYIPAVFRNLLDWGFEAIKWDCLLNTMRVNDQFRKKRRHPDMSTNEAMHRVVAAGRKVIGENFYLLGCTGMERATMEAMDIFDACRIGGDVFSWEDFKCNAVVPLFSYFPFHNTSIYLDPDTLVLREEYSTFEQAKSRISLFALGGLQFTLGDAICDLDKKRIDALKCAMPTVLVTPQEMCRKDFRGDTAMVMISAASPGGTWFVAGVFNMTEEKQECSFDLSMLPQGNYAAFEFWEQSFKGIVSDRLVCELPPGGCAVFRLTQVQDVPFLIGSSRHLLQGVAELKEYSCDREKGVVSGKVQTVGEEEMQLTFFVPDNCTPEKQPRLKIRGNIATLTVKGNDSSVEGFQINYKEKQK